MNQNLFLSSSTVQPSTRWLDAFPEGRCCEWNALVADARPFDVIWIASTYAGWEGLLARLNRILPECPAVVLSMAPEGEEAVLALDHGARGYCHALSVPVLMREVALVVRHGGLWIGPELMARVIGAASRTLPPPAQDVCPPGLSMREAEVAREVAGGRSNKEIAATLGITERTVKAHLGTIFEKLGVRDRLQLVLRLAAGSDISPRAQQ